MFQYLLHAVLQMSDGILTYIGVTNMEAGIDAEGNFLIHYAMTLVGPGWALFLTKAAGLVLLFAFIWPNRSLMLDRVMVGVNLVYALIVTQWIYILTRTFWT